MADAKMIPGARTQLDRAWKNERLAAMAILFALVACVGWFAPAYLAGDEPAGEDASSHVLAAARLAEHLQAGSPGWWLPDLNLGFPLAHFYQPLPHLFTAVVALGLGGPEEAPRAYKLVVCLLLAALPFTAYLGGRRLGMSRTGAVVAAVALAVMSSPREYYGLTTRHYLLLGLHTLLWGAVFAPLALAEGVRFIQGGGRASLAVGAFTLLFLGHGLLALGMIPVYAFAAAYAPQTGKVTFGQRFGRLVSLGLLSGICLAAWLVPQLACSEYFGGWPFSDELRRDGLGIERLLADWSRGRLTDFHRLPIVAIMTLVGIIWACMQMRRRPVESVAVFGLTLFLIFTAGRKTFGSAVDWVFPPNTRIEGMLRWVAMLQLFFALTAGIGAEAWSQAMRRSRAISRHPWLNMLVVATPLVALAVPRHLKDLDLGLETFSGTAFENLDRPAYLHVAAELAAEEEPGRVYTGEELGLYNHWSMAHLALVAGKPMTLSHGVGVQDSLNLFYVSYLRILDEQLAAPLARLFNVRYVWHRPEHDLAFLDPELVARRGIYKAVRLPGDYGYFDVIGEPQVVDELAPVEARQLFLRWMRSGYPQGARFLRLPGEIRARFPTLPKSNLAQEARAADDEPAFEIDRRRHGRVLEEEAGLSRYAARVRVRSDEAWVLLKVTPHPFWEATVDEEPVPLYHLSPAFLGLPVTQGEHSIELTFRAPGWQKLLLFVGPLVLVALFVFDRDMLKRWIPRKLAR